MTKYVALSTQSVGVGPGMSRAPDRPLRSEPNHLPFVARFETSRLDIHTRVSPRVIIPFMPIQLSHHSPRSCVGRTLLDCFVKPTLPVSDYRTNVTSISPQDLESRKCRIFIFPDGTPPTYALRLAFPNSPQMVLSPSTKSNILWHQSLPTR